MTPEKAQTRLTWQGGNVYCASNCAAMHRAEFLPI